MKLLINSDSLTNTSGVYQLNSSYSIQYKNGLVTIDKLVIPQSFYNIVSKTITVNSTLINLTDGQYNISDLCSHLQSIIRTATADASFTVTYNSNTLYVTIARTTNFTIDFTVATSIASFIGFNATSLSGANTYTSTNAYNPYKMGTIGFCTDLFQEYNPVDNTNNYNCLICWIPQTTVPDSYIIYTPSYIIDLPVWNKKTQIRDTKFRFIKPNGSLVDFKGIPWFAEININ